MPFLPLGEWFPIVFKLLRKFIRYKHEVSVALVFKLYFQLVFINNFSEFFLLLSFFPDYILAQCIASLSFFQPSSILLLCSATGFRPIRNKNLKILGVVFKAFCHFYESMAWCIASVRSSALTLFKICTF